MVKLSKIMKLSIAIATYNEEKNIARCLESVKGWVDEIVVVDGSSVDKTKKIAEGLGAEVFLTSNKPMFHINKQIAIGKCQGDWILQLDADEVVSSELKAEILKILAKGSDFNAFWLPRKNYFLGKWLKKTGQYPDPVIRFFKRGRAKLPCRSVHEQMKVEGKTGKFNGHLLHFPYPSFSDYLQKSDRYTSLTAKEMIDSGEKPSFWLFFKYCLKVKKDFLVRFVRCKGFLDGFPGFVFSLYSGLHNITSYIKFWEISRRKK